MKRTVHPGEMLREEYLKPLNMSSDDLALAISVTPQTVRALVEEKSNLTKDLAVKLALYFKTSSQFWVNIQRGYEKGI
jgi:addiction module HigA family antidote